MTGWWTVVVVRGAAELDQRHGGDAGQGFSGMEEEGQVRVHAAQVLEEVQAGRRDQGGVERQP